MFATTSAKKTVVTQMLDKRWKIMSVTKKDKQMSHECSLHW